jgi:hypothetical protein
MSSERPTRRWLRLGAGALAAGGLTLSATLSALGLASTAQAAPLPVPAFHYHWCPGDWWNPGWGNNWDWGHCHDWDDWGAPAGWGPPPPWAPPPPPPPPWAPGAGVIWNPGTNNWGVWNNGIWVGL